MKKFITLTLIATVLTTGAFAANIEKASNRAAAHLEANYTSAKNVTWSYTGKYEKASITLDGQKVDVYYDEYGDLIGSTTVVAFDKLPKTALDTITTDYTFPDYQLTDCIRFTDADNHSTYYVSFDFDGNSVVLAISNNGAITQM